MYTQQFHIITNPFATAVLYLSYSQSLPHSSYATGVVAAERVVLAFGLRCQRNPNTKLVLFSRLQTVTSSRLASWMLPLFVFNRSQPLSSQTPEVGGAPLAHSHLLDVIVSLHRLGAVARRTDQVR
jgi:hypothetical protein